MTAADRDLLVQGLESLAAATAGSHRDLDLHTATIHLLVLLRLRWLRLTAAETATAGNFWFSATATA